MYIFTEFFYCKLSVHIGSNVVYKLKSYVLKINVQRDFVHIHTHIWIINRIKRILILNIKYLFRVIRYKNLRYAILYTPIPIIWDYTYNFIRIFSYIYLLQNYIILTYYNKYFIILFMPYYIIVLVISIPIIINMYIWYFPRFIRIRCDIFIQLSTI